MIPEAFQPPSGTSNPIAEDFHSQGFHSGRTVSRMSR
jgi:hypothetical protein